MPIVSAYPSYVLDNLNLRSNLEQPKLSTSFDVKPKSFQSDNFKLKSKQALNYVAIQNIMKEKEPERQKMYELLADKALCQKLLNSAKPNESYEVSQLRNYFTKNPINLVGLAENRIAFFNVMDAIDEAMTRQINDILKKPRSEKEYTQAVFTLMLMHKGFKDFNKHLKKDPEPFFQGIKYAENLVVSPNLLKAGVKPKFSGQREDLNKTAKQIGKYHGGLTAGTCALFNAALSTGLTVSAAPTLGILPAIVAYAKFAKSVNDGHSEVKYFGKSLTDDLTSEVFVRENPEDELWQKQKKFIYDNLKKFQLPWKVLKPIEAVYDKLNTSDKLAETIQTGSRSGSELIQNGFKQIAKSRGYYPPDFEEIWKNYDIPNQFWEITNQGRAWAQHYGEIQADHIQWDTLESTFSSVADMIEAVDDSIPIVGIVLSMWKAAAVYNNGSQVSTIAHRDQSSSLSHLQELGEYSSNKFATFPNFLPVQTEKITGFVEKYFENLEDYNPLTTLVNTFDKLFGDLFKDD